MVLWIYECLKKIEVCVIYFSDMHNTTSKFYRMKFDLIGLNGVELAEKDGQADDATECHCYLHWEMSEEKEYSRAHWRDLLQELIEEWQKEERWCASRAVNDIFLAVYPICIVPNKMGMNKKNISLTYQV
jgi:hypothetical protein